MGITPERLSETLREVCHALGDAGVPFAVAGGHAVAMHGQVRATRDIDLLELWRLHRASIDIERLRADAQAIGDDVLSLLDALLLGPAVRESGSVDERWHRGL
jgi:hypothetical protein